MDNDKFAKLQERNRAMRKARDEVLCRVGSWLTTCKFTNAGVGHFTRDVGEFVCHIGFQKLSSGRDVRVMCHLNHADDTSVTDPTSDAYTRPNSPNGQKYLFGWSTRESDIARSAAEYCRYLEDVVIAWFKEQIGR